MAERLAEYLGRHQRALRREGTVLEEGEEPRVLQVVVYDGERRWRRGAAPPGVPFLLQLGDYLGKDDIVGFGDQ